MVLPLSVPWVVVGRSPGPGAMQGAYAAAAEQQRFLQSEEKSAEETDRNEWWLWIRGELGTDARKGRCRTPRVDDGDCSVRQRRDVERVTDDVPSWSAPKSGGTRL